MIQFDEKTHRYTLDGKVLTNVTKVLHDAGLTPDYGDLDPWYALRGTLTHLACQYEDEGCLDEKTVDPEILPRLMSWRAFKKLYGVKVIVSEMIVHDAHIAGTLDKLAEVDGKLYLLDIKSGSKADFHSIQTFAYWTLLPAKYRTALRGAVYLKPQLNKLGYRFVPHDDDEGDALQWESAIAPIRKQVMG